MTHRVHHVNGFRLHTVEAGEGPLVLMVHGFPESWYSWRHQLPGAGRGRLPRRGHRRARLRALVEARTRSTSTACCASSPTTSALVEALGETQAVVVGHDWGAPIAWNSALLRPDVFRAVAGLSVPFSPPSDTRPSEAFRAMGGAEEFYIEYFQEPGRAEAEIEADVRTGCSASTSRRRVTRRPRRTAGPWRRSRTAPA